MIVMPSNSTGERMRRLVVEYPDQLGHLFSTRPEGGDGWFTPWLPYALDNGAYGAHRNGTRWKQRDYLGLCEKAVLHAHQTGEAPLWLLAPDVVTDRAATLRNWEAWAPDLRRWYGWPLAFALQDGMEPGDEPQEADILFLGGSVWWKRRQLRDKVWTGHRLHVGKINGYGWLWASIAAGAESCDGTGWFRGDRNQLAGLERFLGEWRDGHRSRPHGALWNAVAGAA